MLLKLQNDVQLAIIVTMKLTLMIGLILVVTVQGRRKFSPPGPPGGSPGGDGCVHHGIQYEEGDNFMNECNQCRCFKNGVAACTAMMCHQELADCEHNGLSYFHKEAFMDDCNVCRCRKNGLVSCTKKRC